MLNLFNSLSATIRIVIIAVISAVALWMAYTVFIAPAKHKSETTQARAEATVAEAATGAATEGITIIADATSKKGKTDEDTRKSSSAILSERGASTPVPRALHDAGIAALCVRANAASDPACAELLHEDSGGKRP